MKYGGTASRGSRAATVAVTTLPVTEPGALSFPVQPASRPATARAAPSVAATIFLMFVSSPAAASGASMPARTPQPTSDHQAPGQARVTGTTVVDGVPART